MTATSSCARCRRRPSTRRSNTSSTRTSGSSLKPSTAHGRSTSTTTSTACSPQAGPVVITRDFATGFVTNTTIDSVTTATTYDDYGDRENYAASFGGTVLYSEAHERDDIGRITKTTEVVEGVTKVWEYAYDFDGRLAVAYVDGALRYSYTL